MMITNFVKTDIMLTKIFVKQIRLTKIHWTEIIMSKIAMTKIMITNIFFDEDPYYMDQNDKDLLDKDDEKVCRLWSVPTTIAKTKMMKRLIVAGSSSH